MHTPQRPETADRTHVDHPEVEETPKKKWAQMSKEERAAVKLSRSPEEQARLDKQNADAKKAARKSPTMQLAFVNATLASLLAYDLDAHGPDVLANYEEVGNRLLALQRLLGAIKPARGPLTAIDAGDDVRVKAEHQAVYGDLGALKCIARAEVGNTVYLRVQDSAGTVITLPRAACEFA